MIENNNISSRLFTRYRDNHIQQITKCHILTDNLNAPSYTNATILPLRRKQSAKSQNGIYEGGVCSETGDFVGGLARSNDSRPVNYSCKNCYSIQDTNLPFRDETVVFGGVLIPHFGHTMVDCLSRLWWIVKNPTFNYKLIFVRIPNDQRLYISSFLEAAGLHKDQWEILEKPSRFREVIVPDEAVFSLSGVAHLEWLLFFEYVKEQLRNQSHNAIYSEKLYLTRRFLETPEGVNEEYYENFFSERGYQVLALEKMPFEEQVCAIMEAKEIVCTMGTLSHYALFANNQTKISILLRVPEAIVWPQNIINIVRDLDWAYIESTNTPLPTTHSNSISLYCPTIYFKRYLDANDIVYSMDELDNLEISDQLYMQYFRTYAKFYSVPQKMKLICQKDMFDVIAAMNLAFSGVELKRTTPEKKGKSPVQKNTPIMSQWLQAKKKLKKICPAFIIRLYKTIKNKQIGT